MNMKRFERKDASGVTARLAPVFELKGISDKGVFSGYGSVFGNVDQGGDIVEKGAFALSLAEISRTSKTVPILWQHNPEEPIGVWEDMKEDDHGLLMKGRLLIDDVAKAREAYALMKANAVRGLSIGYRTRDYSIDEVSYTRRLKQLDLVETSVVTFPMNEEAQVTTVKSTIAVLLKSGRLPTLAEFEDYLREAGFSNSQAKAIAGHGLRKLLSEQRDAEPDAAAIADVLSGFRI
jgi:HK97 family phage prohead protease